ncbi:hypothetical protein [Acidisphaera sp. L21]|jgi:hypothetical protein|uniref:hypothetical protein n=1 Tax=Acidisphaera sp. L21 TaxID=1641851 RepID=UPI00131C1B8C|nr:hypothetical protein [Acidisphaera sp. L21]
MLSILRRLPPYAPALMLLVALTMATLARARVSAPGGEVALVFPPWWSQAQVMSEAAAEGQVIRLGPWRSVVVIRPTTDGQPGGAWLRLNPIMAGCGDVA